MSDQSSKRGRESAGVLSARVDRLERVVRWLFWLAITQLISLSLLLFFFLYVLRS